MDDSRKRLIDALSTIVDVLLDHSEPAQSAVSGDRYYDATTAPCGRRTFLRAAAAGWFPSFRRGRKVLARRSDVHHWIESQSRAKTVKAPVDRKESAAEIMERHGIVATRRPS